MNVRQGTGDLAKGVAVLLMIQVHLTELFARPEIFDSVYGRVSLFFGGPPVAPLFMVVLGYFLAASRRTTAQLLARGAAMLGVGLLLNLGLNLHLLMRIARGELALNPWEYVFGADILFLAGFAILLLALLRPLLRASVLTPLAMALGVAVVTPLVNAFITGSTISPYVLAFVGGAARWSYFPLFPWLAYPLLGWAFYGLRSSAAIERWSAGVRRGVLAVAGMVVVATLPYAVGTAAKLPEYYHHGLLFFGWMALFLLVWVAALTMLNQHAGQSLPLCYVKGLGKHVTVVYVLQWLIIGNLATGLYRTLSLPQVLLWYGAVVGTVSVVVYLLENRHKPRHLSSEA